ncbi:hypothetical protein LPJ61_002797, partial [Coemansia biformis]
APELFGTVAAVIMRSTDRTYAGSLSAMPPAQLRKHGLFLERAGRDVLWFQPLSTDVPIMALPLVGVPAALRGCRRGNYCTVRMAAWPAAEPVPRAEFVAELGERSGIEAETLLILAEHSVCTEPPAPDVVRCLPSIPWRIPPADLARRTDLRSWCIFTIDPSTARDLDDAVSCRLLPGGTLLIGVHIADVAYFVRPGTALDRQAQARATTTYMVQRAYPMLPAVLCEDLCSLSPGTDRFAFSVMWEMDPASGDVLSTWFGRTVISSACKLSYDDAQSVIEGRGLPSAAACIERAAVKAGPHRRGEIEAAVLQLDTLARKLRRRRFDAGALSLNNVKLTFELDAAGVPVACQQYPIRDSNRLIEEFMLLANMSVAARVEASFPDAALLRRHPPPLQRRLDEVCKRLKLAGVDIDAGSPGDISRSLGRIDSANARHTVEEMLTGPMQRASYFATSAIGDKDEYHHYALNVPLYTHFTSPIRRYADIVVHRALEASLAVHGNHITNNHPLLPAYVSPHFPTTSPEGSLTTSASAARSLLVPGPEALAAIAHQCNQRKGAAKAAQEASTLLFLAHYLAAMAKRTDTPGIITPGVVTNIGDNGITFATPHLGVSGTVYMDRMADVAGQVVSTDGRTWRLSLWSVGEAGLQLVWRVTPPPASSGTSGADAGDAAAVARLAGRLSEMAVGGTGGAATETVTQTLRVFSAITVCVIAEHTPPSLAMRLAMPGACGNGA